MSYRDMLAADRRICILLLLKEAGGSTNENVLRIGLTAMGRTIGLTYEAVREDMDFLSREMLVGLTIDKDQICSAKLTKRGVDVAEGRLTVAGISPPSVVA